MGDTGYTIAQYASDLRAIAAETSDPHQVIARVRPLALKASLDKALIQPAHYECDPEGGIGLHLLHAEPDHSLAVFMVSWLPGRGVTPHDHGTWAVVAGVDGPEVNTFWKRLDDGTREGYAELASAGEQAIGAGEVVSMLPEGIHSVRNDSHQITLSLHTYGVDPGHSPRYQYDVDARIMRPHPRSAPRPARLSQGCRSRFRAADRPGPVPPPAPG